MEFVSSRVQQFFSDKAKGSGGKDFLLLRVCGYSSGRPLPEVWQVGLAEGESLDPFRAQSEGDFGIQCNGEQEALNRLIVGIGTIPAAGAKAIGISQEQPAETLHTFEQLILPAAPIQDAIGVARHSPIWMLFLG